jgi:hypothetical protein
MSPIKFVKVKTKRKKDKPHKLRLSRQQILELAAMYRAGVPRKEIASTFGVHKNTVRRYLLGLGELEPRIKPGAARARRTIESLLKKYNFGVVSQITGLKQHELDACRAKWGLLL